MDKNDRDEDEQDHNNATDEHDEWQLINLEAIEETTPFGFVIDHFAWWGIAIPGFPEERQPSEPTDPASAPKTLKVKDIEIETDKWTGGDFTFTATRTPPLFHAFHHKTNEALFPKAFERRSERNLVERPFEPRNPLPGKGLAACVPLFDATFDDRGESKSDPNESEIPFEAFDSRDAVKAAIDDGYFQTFKMQWDTTVVGPLNALWFVIFRKGSNNLPINRLEDDYRLWHNRGHDGTLHGYDWTLWQKDNYKKLKIEVKMSGVLNANLKDCPEEQVTAKFELEWD